MASTSNCDDSWLNLLTERAALLQDVSNRLAELEKTWTATRAAAQAANAPEPILRQIDETLASLAAAAGAHANATHGRARPAGPRRQGGRPVRKCAIRD